MHTNSAVGNPQPKFALGQVVITPNALEHLTQSDIQQALYRHNIGDWGKLDPHDMKQNERALQSGGRLFSEYFSARNVKFWIITEADRSVTTILLPEDY